MAPNSNQQIIVREWAGSYTGETYVQTADGRVWKKVDFIPTLGTGEKSGKRIGRIVWED